MTSYINCFLDSARGQYIPRDFALAIDIADWRGISESDLLYLKQGPEQANYWETWESVLDNAETRETGAILVTGESGDLFLFERDKANADWKEHVESSVEYETTHIDAGNNYAHMPAESWSRTDDDRLREQCAAHGVAFCGLDIDDVANLALDNFTMESGHMFSNMESEFIVLDSYAVSEIEIQIPAPFLDVLQWLDSDDAYIADESSEFAYVTTDCFWSAVVKPSDLAELIKESQL